MNSEQARPRGPPTPRHAPRAAATGRAGAARCISAAGPHGLRHSETLCSFHSQWTGARRSGRPRGRSACWDTSPPAPPLLQKGLHPHEKKAQGPSTVRHYYLSSFVSAWHKAGVPRRALTVPPMWPLASGAVVVRRAFSFVVPQLDGHDPPATGGERRDAMRLM